MLATFAHINFQPSTSTPPTGYFADSGLAYANRGNGFSYGWMFSSDGINGVPTNNAATRDRGAGTAFPQTAPLSAYYTLNHFHKAGTSPLTQQSAIDPNLVSKPTWWQIGGLTPGATYQVRVVSGDNNVTGDNGAGVTYPSHYHLYANGNIKAGSLNQTGPNAVPAVNDTGVELVNKQLATTTPTNGTDNFAIGNFTDVTIGSDGILRIIEASDSANNKINFIDIDTTVANPVPASPTALALSNVSASKIHLHWVDNSSNENGFRIEASVNGGAFAPFATVGLDTTDFDATGLTPQTQYAFRVFAFNTTGDSANFAGPQSTTTVAATGTVGSSFANTTGTINLTDEGTLDWVHFGQTSATSVERKNGANLISDPVALAGSPREQKNDSVTKFTWTDGNPAGTASATDSSFAFNTRAFAHGFSFTVPADTTTRVLKVYVGVNNITGQLSTQLSDGSAANVASTFSNGGVSDGVYTIAYKAGTANQTMTVTWQEVPGDGDQAGGSVNLKAATLTSAPPAPTGAFSNVSATALNSGRVRLSWDASNVTGASAYNIERAPDNAGQPGAFAQIGQVPVGTNVFLDNTSSASPNIKFYYRVTAVNIAFITGTPSAPVSATTLNGPFGTGALATYYALPGNLNGQNDPTLPSPSGTSIDPTINWDWTTNKPTNAPAGFQTDNFIVRYTAKVKPEFTGDYTFYVNADDGYRLIVDGVKLFDNLGGLGGLGADHISAPITLQAGVSYDIILDMEEQGGNAGVKLGWSTDNLPREIIPTATLYQQALDTTPPQVTSVGVDTTPPPTALQTYRQHLVVKFNENVGRSLDVNDIFITDAAATTSYAGSQLAVAYDPTTNTAVITFPGVTGVNGGPDQVIPDGHYILKIYGSTVNDGSGNLLDGAANGTPGSDYSVPFFVYSGDFTGDGHVDFNDLVVLAQHYNKSNQTYATGDANHDGSVDFNDLVVLAQRYNTTIPATPASPVAASPLPSLPNIFSAPAPVQAPAASIATKKAPDKPKKPTPVFSNAPISRPAPKKTGLKSSKK